MDVPEFLEFSNQVGQVLLVFGISWDIIGLLRYYSGCALSTHTTNTRGGLRRRCAHLSLFFSKCAVLCLSMWVGLG